MKKEITGWESPLPKGLENRSWEIELNAIAENFSGWTGVLYPGKKILTSLLKKMCWHWIQNRCLKLLKIFSKKLINMNLLSQLVKMIFLALISLYQSMVSPVIGSNCRFYPSCSKYAYQAIDLHGPAKGFFLTAKRLLKCHPFHPGGYDPVPEKI